MQVSEGIQSFQWWARQAKLLAKRALLMAGAWSLVGVAVGINTGRMLGGNQIALLAQIIAGVIVLSGLGAVTGLVGARALPTWVGALLGGLLATAIGQNNAIAPEMQLNLGIIMGALVGATCWPWLRMIVYLATRLRTMQTSAN